MKELETGCVIGETTAYSISLKSCNDGGDYFVTTGDSPAKYAIFLQGKAAKYAKRKIFTPQNMHNAQNGYFLV